MMFDNEISPDPTLRAQLVQHIPIAILVVGVLGTLIAMHLAIASLIALTAAHAVIGGVLLVVRRFRARSTSGARS